jgi:hypothetical protein
MKKIFYIAIVVVTMSSIFSSCKHTERCPAYGKVTTEQVQKSV